MVATGLVPAIINFYYHRTQNSKTCLEHANIPLTNIQWERGDVMGENNDSLTEKMRGFPVVVLFHIIATACCWFMNFQQAQQNRNVLTIEKLKRDLVEARAENAPGKNQTKGNASADSSASGEGGGKKKKA